MKYSELYKVYFYDGLVYINIGTYRGSEDKKKLMEGVLVVMNQEMMDNITKNNLVFLATASADGTPNVVPIGLAKPLDNKTVLLVANFMKKTIQNLKNNPKA